MIEAILEKRDVLAVLPTGYGKSLPYQMYVPLRRKLSGDDYRKQSGMHDKLNEPKVSVCSPLLALMGDQVNKLNGVPEIRHITNDDDKLRNGQFDYMFGSPELFVGSNKWREMIRESAIDLIVIDEFHTIATWGEKERDGKEAFRKWFGFVGGLRSLLPSATVLALSATCTNQVKRRVMKALALKPETLQIAISPNRPYIKLTVERISKDISFGFSWIVDALSSGTFPKTLLYCTSINDCSKLYSYLLSELESQSELIEMYHSETPPTKKEEIIEDLKSENSALKLVIATNALGMGIDIRNCCSAILFGASFNILDIVQEIGRVGRDRSPSSALILFNSNHIGHTSPEVKSFLRERKCYRYALMECFLNEGELALLNQEECGKHTCCSFCTQSCKCGKCSHSELEIAFGLQQNLETKSDSESDGD
ncbi:hypothetical protein FSP39_014645 [Pinctada imbricata]|uniref:DNA 3'-5' helicase n=1 Tax=Pinctada imbricata TaxID=66713 RepID=A0AA88YL43_PINIB|nr:hypothetical protein FSP39_014645 [Pinctada imbricata]